jgi:SnoaL-like domain
MPARSEVERLIAMVESRQYLEAIAEFYAPHATMQENLNPPRVGLEALLENERKALRHFFAEPPAAKAESFLVDGDRVAIHWIFEYTRRSDGRAVRLDEIAYQRWDGNRIVEERYAYDPASAA